MDNKPAVSPASQTRIVKIDGATFEVTSNYVGNISFIDLLKHMLKRDLERPEE